MKASLPAAVGASVGAVKTAVDVCVTSLMSVEDEASLVEFLCGKEAFALPLVTEIEVGAL